MGFNLPFDLSRLAIAAAPSRGQFGGGNSLRLWDDERYCPRIVYKAIDSRRSLIGFTAPDGRDPLFRGSFLDLRTLSLALTDLSFSLDSACAAFDVPYQKRPVAHGAVTEEYGSYCREDVGATASLYRAATAEFRRHPIDLLPTKALSPASIGKSYLRTMGVTPVLERQPDFPTEVLGQGMAAVFGGRAECRIRKTPVPVVYVDCLSMYPTVNALMRTWGLVIARKIVVDDVTAEVQELIASPDLLDQSFQPDLWPKLTSLVEIKPMGPSFPFGLRTIRPVPTTALA